MEAAYKIGLAKGRKGTKHHHARLTESKAAENYKGTPGKGNIY